MKKRFLMGFAVVAAASMLCGFDSTETLDSLSEKMAAAEVDMKSVSMNMNCHMDVGLPTNYPNIIPLIVDYPMQIDCTLDPVAIKVDGSVTVEIGSGEDAEQATRPLEQYMVMDEGGIMTIYEIDESGSWTAQSTDIGIDLKEFTEAASGQSMSYSDMAEWGLNFELAPEAADVDGAECYLISCALDFDTLNTLLAKVSEMTGEDLTANPSVSSYLKLFEGHMMNVEYYVDASTYLPSKLHMDTNGDTVSEISPDAIVLNAFSLDATISYDTVDEIVIPDEALAASVSEIDLSALDAAAAGMDAETTDTDAAMAE